MKAKEFQEILIEGLTHTDDSRTEFYLNKAKEYGYSPLTFFNGLHEAYKRFNKYVNSDCYYSWGTENADGTGKKIYQKNNISLSHITNGESVGILDHENIVVLAQTLYELGDIVRSQIDHSDDKWKSLHDGLIELGLIEESKNFSKAMKEHHLPEKDKILWIGTKSAGVYFCKQGAFKLPDFNKCFRHYSGTEFRHQNLKKEYRNFKLKKLISETSQ